MDVISSYKSKSGNNKQVKSKTKASDEYNEFRIVTRNLEQNKLDTKFDLNTYNKLKAIIGEKFTQQNTFLCHDVHYKGMLYRRMYEGSFEKEPKIQLFVMDLLDSKVSPTYFTCTYKRTLVPMHNLPSTTTILANKYVHFTSFRVTNNFFINLEKSIQYDLKTDTFHPMLYGIRLFVWNNPLTPAQEQSLKDVLTLLESIFQSD